jgi:EAL domain-containing protein (putative c-di-GMP-specific phosphodiesterase class I)
MKAARRLIEELAPTGCGFALAEMNGDPRNRHLARELKPRFLRLQSSLTHDLREHSDHVEQIEQVVHDARAIDAVTIASDVGNSSDLAVLWQCGVKLVSGDFLQDTPRVIGV